LLSRKGDIVLQILRKKVKIKKHLLKTGRGLPSHRSERGAGKEVNSDKPIKERLTKTWTIF